MIPFKEKEKAVKTFVQNLRDGVVEMNLVELRRYRMATYYQGIIASIESFVKMSSNNKKSEYQQMVEKLHDNILELRMYGSLKNEFMYVDCETLKAENKKLVLENIQLARELKDSQNIIQQYESPAYKKNGDTQ